MGPEQTAADLASRWSRLQNVNLDMPDLDTGTSKISISGRPLEENRKTKGRPWSPSLPTTANVNKYTLFIMLPLSPQIYLVCEWGRWMNAVFLHIYLDKVGDRGYLNSTLQIVETILRMWVRGATSRRILTYVTHRFSPEWVVMKCWEGIVEYSIQPQTWDELIVC